MTTTQQVNVEATALLLWRLAYAAAAIYLAWSGQWLPAGVFALAAK